VDDIGWTPRTRNALERNLGLTDRAGLANLTFGELLDLRGIGAKGILDFSCTLEAAMDSYNELVEEHVCPRVPMGEHGAIRLLSKVVNESWTAQVSGADPRFSDIIPGDELPLRSMIEDLLAELDPGGRLSEIPRLVSSVEKIKSMVVELQAATLEKSLASFLEALTGAKDFRLRVLSDRLGWSGIRPLTLRECAERLNVSRERVRQLQQRALARIPSRYHEVFMPALDRALMFLEERAPISVKLASKKLREAGITETDFHIESLLGIARLFGKTTSLEISASEQAELLVKGKELNTARTVFAFARRLAARSGVLSAAQLEDVLATEGDGISGEVVRDLLDQAAPDIQRIGDGWYFVSGIPPNRNRLRNVARKILSVNSPQSIISVRDGIRRSFRVRSSLYPGPLQPVVPPIPVLEAFFSMHPEFTVNEGLVWSVAPLDYKLELGETEQVFVDVLRSSPNGVMDRRSLAEGCISRGMNENTFNVYSTYSCVLEHIGLDLWTLRGTRVDPRAAEAVRSYRLHTRSGERVKGHGWTNEGKLYILAVIPEHNKSSLVLGCPAPIKRFLAGRRFQCYAKGVSTPCGQIVVKKDGSSYGYGTFVSRYGLDENDLLLVEFDIVDDTATLSIGDDSLLDLEL